MLTSVNPLWYFERINSARHKLVHYSLWDEVVRTLAQQYEQKDWFTNLLYMLFADELSRRNTQANPKADGYFIDRLLFELPKSAQAPIADLFKITVSLVGCLTNETLGQGPLAKTLTINHSRFNSYEIAMQLINLLSYVLLGIADWNRTEPGAKTVALLVALISGVNDLYQMDVYCIDEDGAETVKALRQMVLRLCEEFEEVTQEIGDVRY